MLRQLRSGLSTFYRAMSSNNSKKDVQLYCSWFCPFAQRAWIALLEKKVDFEYIEIDPYKKTPEFLAVSPRGLVPSIVHKGRPVYESIICVEYVDDVWKGQTSFMPSDPYDRAMARIWVDFISKRIVPVFYTILQRQEKEDQELAKMELLKHLETLIRAMSEEGPFFMGDTFGFVDIILVPYVIRFDILKHYRGFELPEDGLFERLQKWSSAVMSLESVKGTLADKEKLLQMYERYATNTAKSEVADAIRDGKPLP